jgi:O-antigen ligase/tetratricopeptide (TPR) repeat protein
MQKLVRNIFFTLVLLSLLSPVWVFRDLLFPFVTSKAFYFRILIELAFPLYIYLLISNPSLRPKWKKNPLNILVVLFLVLSTVSAFSGIGFIRSMWGNFERMGGVFYLAHLTAFYFYIVMLGQMGKSYLKTFLNCFILSALIIALNGISGKLGLGNLTLDASLPARVSSTLGNPIYVGSYLVIPLFLALFLGKQAELIWKKAFYFVSAFLFFVTILLSGTRGALVGILAGGFLSSLVYLFLTTNKKVRYFGLLGVAVLIGGYILISININSLNLSPGIQRLFRLNDSNSQARLIQWQVALEGYKEYPTFGVGPENYFVIANKYYNPEIYKYDRSWFDKPHNYILEILVTTGIFGFLAYAGVFFAMIWAFYKGYKNELLSLLEFCALLAALLVYQIQNLTVFDTIPASLTYFGLAGLAGYILTAANEASEKKVIKNNNVKSLESLALAFGGVSFVVICYLIYVGNILPMSIGKNVNYGYAYASVDPARANDFFQAAVNAPFNFDKTQTAQKYSEFASAYARTSGANNQELANKIKKQVISFINEALKDEPKHPILWQNLAEMYMLSEYKGGTAFILSEEAKTKINGAITKAINLVPQREEPYLTLAEIRAISGDIEGAEKVLKDIINKFPNNIAGRVQLASLERYKKNYQESIKLITEAQNFGYNFPNYETGRWVVEYYLENKDFDKALKINEAAQLKEKDNPVVYVDLVRIYVGLGRIEQARSLAINIMNQIPEYKEQMQKLLELLPK